ncbi:hypothetical protein DM01DRAFT_1075248 [Hesseltinella vesiculosa]|uniref:Uncharacterized protein n=1 Tax=Hesseltinella vesiculosa TaxID=101127 RepID=A0A1X2GW29_9FUNG|nr:hypothetical protein DM01DRAFT_1075248 [Hesseltinella vesiculosa]
MGKVTYGIRFSQKSPFSQEIRETKQRLKRYATLGKHLDAAKTCLTLADLLLMQADYMDADEDILVTLQDAIKYASKAIRTFTQYESHHGLAKSYMLTIRCLLKQEDYDKAIDAKGALLTLFKLPNAKVKDKRLLQQAYSLIGDCYLSRSQQEPGCAKYMDLVFANKYYERERRVLDCMTVDDVANKDASELRALNRSSFFNLGLTKAKLQPYQEDEAAITYLQKAIKSNKTLQDKTAERRAWWELGNLHYRRRDWDKTLECQRRDLDLGQQLQEDELESYVELIRTCLEREDYPTCMDLTRRMRIMVFGNLSYDPTHPKPGESGCSTTAMDHNDDLLIDIDDFYPLKHHNTNGDGATVDEDLAERQALVKLVIQRILTIRDRRDELQTLVERKITGRPLALVCLSLGQQLTEADMLASALPHVDMGLAQFNTNDQGSWSHSLGRLHLELLKLKADLHWQLRDMNKQDLLALNRKILGLINHFCNDRQDKSDYLVYAVERCRDIYLFFEDNEMADIWDHKLQTVLENVKDTDHQMDLDPSSQQKEEPLASPTSQALFPKPLFDMSQVSTSFSVTVAVPLNQNQIQLGVICEDSMETMDWLMSKVAGLCWQLYSIEPVIRQFKFQDKLYSQTDMLYTIMDQKKTGDYQLVAVVDGIVEKPLVDIYDSICSRRKHTASPRIQDIMRQQTAGSKLSLHGAGKLCHGLRAEHANIPFFFLSLG